jgi:hypothetical protein
MSEQSFQEFKLRVDSVKKLISELELTITNPEARESFLSMPKNYLRKAEDFLASTKTHGYGWSEPEVVAGFALALAELHLTGIRKLVN